MAWFSLKNHPTVQLASAVKRGMQEREREKDMREYWPLCMAASKGNLQNARSAFYSYTLGKSAWRELYMSENMLRRHVADMTLEGFRRGSAVKGVDDQF
jgi:hypothetical protein